MEEILNFELNNQVKIEKRNLYDIIFLTARSIMGVAALKKNKGEFET